MYLIQRANVVAAEARASFASDWPTAPDPFAKMRGSAHRCHAAQDDKGDAPMFALPQIPSRRGVVQRASVSALRVTEGGGFSAGDEGDCGVDWAVRVNGLGNGWFGCDVGA